MLHRLDTASIHPPREAKGHADNGVHHDAGHRDVGPLRGLENYKEDKDGEGPHHG